jgi:hypothetical protein
MKTTRNFKDLAQRWELVAIYSERLLNSILMRFLQTKAAPVFQWEIGNLGRGFLWQFGLAAEMSGGNCLHV